MKYMTFLGYKVAKNGEYILSYNQKSFLQNLFGLKGKEVQFIGSSTVWHHYPSFVRCHIEDESYLSCRYEKIKFEESGGE